jgi:hypothetical protein
MELASAAREAQAEQAAETDANSPTIVLEVARHRGGSSPAKLRPYSNPSWDDIEQSIRQLDGDAYPSLHLSRDQAGRHLSLNVLGGRRGYVLHEPGEDGWVYYDSSKGDEEIEVCTSGKGYVAPAFYVCKDLDKVVKIVHRFVESGTFE